MVSFSDFKEGYENNWRRMKIRSNRAADAEKQAKRLLHGKEIYQKIERKTGVPWWFAGLCHYRESSFNFDTYLGNGQPLNRVTTIVPKGRGPFLGPDAFVDGAVDAFRIENFLGATDWSIERTLFRLEGFNGYGYHPKGVNSPYLYGGSDVYGPPEARAGKFIRDHVFDSGTVDPQLGTAVILKALMELDDDVDFDGAGAGGHVGTEPDDEAAHTGLWLQQSLNRLGANPQLDEDGSVGPKTRGAISQFQQDNGLTDTGIADAATIAAIERKLGGSIGDSGAVLGGILQRLEDLHKVLRPSQGGSTTPAPNDIGALLERLVTIVQKVQPQTTTPGSPAAPQGTEQLRKALELLNTILQPGGKPPLGQVNGALGQTIGNMLNGKKTALGVFGGLLSTLLPALSNVGALGSLLSPALVAALPQIGVPLSIAMTVWGALGKVEKWAQGTAPPPKPTTS